MKRKEFLQKSLLSGLALALGSGVQQVFGKSNPFGSVYRGIEGILNPTNTHMVGNGFKVMNFFPNGRGFEERMSPFFLLDFNAEVNFPPSSISRGVGVHPHRGIETITFAYKGSVAHHDSAGNSGVINPGDIQWMTAGGGVLHKEYHEKTYDIKGGPFEMVQLWINLPKKHKMVPAKYQTVTDKDKTKIKLANNQGVVNVIAGEYQGKKGPVETYSPVNMYDIHLNPQGEVTLELPGNFNTGILLVDGQVTLNDQKEVKENQYIQFKNESGAIKLKATAKSILLVLSGQPLNEPYVSYGPFVMNTEEEIVQAINDYNAGKFGYLAD